MTLSTIATFHSEIQAQMVKSRLEFEGIQSHLTWQISPMSNIRSNFVLQVLAEDLKVAMEVLALFERD